MTRQRTMIELVIRCLKEAASDAEVARRTDERKARVLLACAVDTALTDLDHALSTFPCNHGACLNTRLEDGSPAHYDQRVPPHPPITGRGYTTGCVCLDCREREQAAKDPQ